MSMRPELIFLTRWQCVFIPDNLVTYTCELLWGLVNNWPTNPIVPSIKAGYIEPTKVDCSYDDIVVHIL